MQQDFDNIYDVESECIMQSTVQKCNFTVQELAEKLGVSRRTIFGYIKIILESHPWLHESVFKPKFGIYSEKALSEIEKLKSLGTEKYLDQVSNLESKLVECEVIQQKVNTLAIYDRKLQSSQIIAASEDFDALKFLADSKQQLDVTTKKLSQIENVTRQVRLQRLKAKAIKQAVEDFEIVQDVYLATMQQLESKLGE